MILAYTQSLPQFNPRILLPYPRETPYLLAITPYPYTNTPNSWLKQPLITIGLYGFAYFVNGIIQYVVFCDCHLSFSMFLRFICIILVFGMSLLSYFTVWILPYYIYLFMSSQTFRMLLLLGY
jgi:hypothetical protein